VRCAADLAPSNTLLKELLFFDLLERGVYMAQRGLVSLSLPFDEAACEEMLGAFEDAVRARRDVLRG
jgi:glutamate-1-semialdehyde 2,1-aminomutase